MKYLIAILAAVCLMAPVSAQENDLTCEACTHAVTELQELIYNRDFVHKIFQEIAALCSKLPVAQDVCQDFVSQLVAQILQIIMQLPARPLCYLLSLCDMSPEPINMPAVLPFDEFMATLPSKENEITCDVCSALMGTLQSMAADKTVVQKLEDFVNKQCEKIPMADMCESLATPLLEAAIQAFEATDAHQDCVVCHLCDSEEKPVHDNDLTCEACTHAVTELQELIYNRDFVHKIFEEIAALCGKLPVAQDVCQDFVSQLVAQILQIIVQLPARPLCYLLSLCDMSETEAFQMPKLLPYDQFMAQLPTKENEITCDVCTSVVGMLQTMAKDPSVAEKFKGFVDKACQEIPMSDMCESLAEPLVDAAIEAFEATDAHHDCFVCHLCDSEPAPIVEDNDITCEACVHAITEIQNLIYNKEFVQKIFEEIAALCSHVPAAEDVCRDFVSQLVGAVLNLLVQTPAHPLCWLLSLCDMGDEKFIMPEPMTLEQLADSLPSKDNDGACDACTAAMGVVLQMLQDKDVQGKVKEFIEKACDSIPMKDMCSSLLDPLLDAAIAAISGMDPKDLCAKLGVCHDDSIQIVMN